MESETIQALKQAATFIRQGDTKSARTILIEILRTNPDNAQAWFMLSYAVPREDKQIYAIQQTLRLEPHNEKAQRRLAKLTGAPLPKPAAAKPEPPKATPKPAAPPAEESGEDLLSQRLFGEPAETPKKPAQTSVDPPAATPEETTASQPLVTDTSSDILEGDPYVVDMEDPDEKKFPIDLSKLPKLPKVSDLPKLPKLTRQQRILIFGAVGLVVVVLVSFFALRPLLTGVFSTWFGQQQTIEPEDAKSTLMAVGQVSTPTPVPPTATPLPSPTPVARQLFNTQDLQPASETTLNEMALIEAQLQSLTGISSDSAPQIYTVSEARLQNFAWDFSDTDAFDPGVNTSQTVFEVFGLANPGSDFTSLYQNLWLDPNGTFYQPEKDFIAITGFDFSTYQKYSFAQAYVQWLRDSQFSFTDSGLYPPCVFPTDSCLAALALVKGEASFTAWQWAQQNMDANAQDELDNATKKYFIVPVLSPSPAMQATHLFPYEQGFTFAREIFQAGGWDTVNALYANPPQTTEQILHPSKYLQGEVGETISYTDLAEILDEEWHPVFQGTLGEWTTYQILSSSTNNRTRLDAPSAEAAAAGWNGDFAQVFTTRSGNRILVGHWKWDTPDDAVAFANGLQTITSIRVGGVQTELTGTSCEQSSAETSCIVTLGQDVVWVLTQDATLAETILENYTFLTAE